MSTFFYCIAYNLCPILKIPTGVAQVVFRSEVFVNILEGQNVPLCVGINNLPADGLGCNQTVGLIVVPGQLAGELSHFDIPTQRNIMCVI